MSMAAEDAAQQVFIKYASIGKKGITLANATLDGGKFAKLCRESKLIGGALTPMDVEGIYLRVSRGFGRLDYEHFIKALDEVAAIKKVSLDAIFNKLAEADPLGGATKTSAVRHHDDHRTHTGMHRPTAAAPRVGGMASGGVGTRLSTVPSTSVARMSGVSASPGSRLAGVKSTK